MTLQSEELRELVSTFALKSSYGTEPHFTEIRAAGPIAVEYFLEAYPHAKSWKQRASFLYHSVRYALTSDAAVDLALLALSDRSREVRYRACMLLAVAQSAKGLEALKALPSSSDDQTQGDVAAAIDAIESKNQNYFVDRDHSGMVTLNVGDGT